MNLLLDTHAFIWWDNDRARLSSKARSLCEDGANVLYLSLASIWEMQIKTQLGKLQLLLPLDQTIRNQIENNRLQILPIRIEHIYGIGVLPSLHNDPFDRLIISQSIIESYDLITTDADIKRYNVNVIW